MFGMWQKVSPKNSQKRPRGKNVVNFSPGSSQSLTIFGGVQTLVRRIRISYVRSGSPLSTTQPTSTHGTVLTCILNVPTHSSIERRQGLSGGFVLAPLHMRLLRRLFLTNPPSGHRAINTKLPHWNTGSVPQCTTEVPFQGAALLIQGHGCSHTVSSPRSQC